MRDFKEMIETAALAWHMYCKRHHLRLSQQNRVMYRARFNLFMSLWLIKHDSDFEMENISSNLISNAAYVLEPITRSKITAGQLYEYFVMQLNHSNIHKVNSIIDNIIRKNKINQIQINTVYDLYSRMNFYYNAVIVDAESKDIEHFTTMTRLIVDDSSINLEQFAKSCFS